MPRSFLTQSLWFTFPTIVPMSLNLHEEACSNFSTLLIPGSMKCELPVVLIRFSILLVNHVGYLFMIFAQLYGFFGRNVYVLRSLFQLYFCFCAVELEESSSAFKFLPPLNTPLGCPEKYFSSFALCVELPGRRALVPEISLQLLSFILVNQT